MDSLFLAGGFLLALLLGLLIIPKILLISYKKRLFDLPDCRKVHTVPIPRLGGISFFPVILMTLCFILGLQVSWGYPIGSQPADEFLFFTVGGMMLFLVGVADDLIGVSYRYKFFIQLLAASLMVCSGEWLNTMGGVFGVDELPYWAGIILTLFIVVYVTNAINLIDGIDGLASGLSCIALLVLGLMCTVQGDYVYALLAFSTFGVIVPFWFYNVFGNARRGHKLFMGDAGSLILGYILSLLAIHLSRTDAGSAAAGGSQLALAFSTLIVPLFDVVRVVMHRLRERRNPFLPDKNHLHHKLLRTGMRPRMVLVAILFIALFFIGLNWLLVDHIGITALLLLDIVLWILLQMFINRCIWKNKKSLVQVNDAEGHRD